jgi:hypothetical protein
MELNHSQIPLHHSRSSARLTFTPPLFGFQNQSSGTPQNKGVFFAATSRLIENEKCKIRHPSDRSDANNMTKQWTFFILHFDIMGL